MLALRPDRRPVRSLLRADLFAMLRILYWLAFLLVTVPITAAILRACSRLMFGLDLDPSE